MKYYTLAAVENYISTLADREILEIPGALLDTYIINHGNIIEILEVKALNSWSSAYTRHIYRKRVPKRFIEWLEREIDEIAIDKDKDNFVECCINHFEYIKSIFEDFNNRELEECVDVGMVSVYPGWVTSYHDYNTTKKHLKKALAKMRKEVKATECYSTYCKRVYG